MSSESLLTLVIGAPLLVFWLIFLSNLPFILRLGRTQKKKKKTAATPFVSILVPARNEAHIIDTLLSHLCAQTYPHYEIILLDDNSTDRTRAIAQTHPVTVIDGQPLPDGWLGKNWACHQLSQAASGDILIFTDADVLWQPDALTAVIAQIDQQAADLLAIFPTQQTETWAERLTVPLIDFVILAYLPIWGVHHLPFTIMSAANGQCLAFRKSAYDAIGGHTAVRNAIVEDIALGRAIKKSKHRLRIALGNRHIACRMYQSAPEVIAGFSKNIVAGYGSIPALIVATLFHWLVFLVPIIWLGSALFFGLMAWPPAVLLLSGIALRGVTATVSHQRPLDAFLMPLTVLLLSRIALRGIIETKHGRLRWKGRPL